MIVLHPPKTDILHFGDGSLAAWRRNLIRRHLQSCATCRRVLTDARTIAERAPTLPTAPFDKVRVWARIQERSAQGDITLLSSGCVVEERVWIKPRMLAVAAGLAAIAWLALPLNADLEAGVSSGKVVADSAAIQPGRAFAIRYSPSTLLESHDTLLLRTTFFSSTSFTASHEDTSVLRRRGKTFVGGTQLPAAARVARIVVMSPDGKTIDDNDGKTWEYVARDASGRPLYDALYTQFRNRERTDWELSHRIVKEMTRYYPNEPNGWRFHASKSLELAGPPGKDSVIGVFHPHLKRMHGMYRNIPADAERSWEMSMLASTLRDTATARFWRDRLLTEHPTAPGATQMRVWQITASERDPQKRIPKFDSLYARGGGNSLQLIFDGFETAVATGDSATLVRWGEHMIKDAQGTDISVAAAFIDHPQLREEGLRRIRQLINSLPVTTDTDWIGAFRRGPAKARDKRLLQNYLGQMALGLTAQGKIRAAHDSLRKAAALGRSPRLARRLADAAIAVGDTAEATQAWAWISADPRTSPAAADSAKVQLGKRMSSEEFLEWTNSARRALKDEVLTTSFHSPLRQRVRLTDAQGRVATIGTKDKQLTAVAFISRHCAPSVGDLESLDASLRRLEAAGVRVFAVIAEKPTAKVQASYAKHGFKKELYYDSEGDAARAFRQQGTPAYYIMDSGTVRFLAREAADLLLQAEALR